MPFKGSIEGDAPQIGPLPHHRSAIMSLLTPVGNLSELAVFGQHLQAAGRVREWRKACGSVVRNHACSKLWLYRVGTS
jgi:hypothetical protein